jgi:L-histidine N-alpha-methyltransferase
MSDKRIEVKNFLKRNFKNKIKEEVYNGLTAKQKSIPSKYFYDAIGSMLFGDISRLPEYYLTRAEMSILKKNAHQMMAFFEHGDLVELGSGANLKVRILLDAAYQSNGKTIRYVPVDVSESTLIAESEELIAAYPELKALCLVADFTERFEIPLNDHPRLFTFFGSTIGNFGERASVVFLKNIAQMMNRHDRFLIGVDMVKPLDILEPAYNDSQGVTAKFNKNILHVVNQALAADFDENDFEHLAFFNKELSRIEMHLRANKDVTVHVKDAGIKISLEQDETIHTEISRKFTKETAASMFLQAGFCVDKWFMDENERFSVVELTV